MSLVYDPIGDDGFELCHPDNKSDFAAIDYLCDGTSRKATWRPIAMHLVRRDRGRILRKSDSPYLLSNSLIFRRSAMESLADLLEPHGEFLPLCCPDEELSLFNVTRVIDALDEEASTVSRLASGRIWMVDRYVFRATEIAGVDAFKIPNLRVSPTFISARIVHRWQSAHLRGLQFNRVWHDPTNSDAIP